MSSIYRKGRDGYFYYQTYVENPESGNRDKRIFHALGTKSRTEAEKKKNSLDLKYKKLSKSSGVLFSKKISSNNLKVLGIIILTVFLTITIDNLLYDRTIKHKTVVNDIINEDRIFEVTPQMIEKKSIIKPNSIVPEINTPENFADNLLNTKVNDSLDETEYNIVIPEYEIIRLERFPDSFNLGKIYITIDGRTNKKNQLALCQKLQKKFNEFSNVVICLYSNNLAGKELARGNFETISAEEQKLNWLALYTFNPVEGEYFDEFPNSYLGVQ